MHTVKRVFVCGIVLFSNSCIVYGLLIFAGRQEGE